MYFINVLLIFIITIILSFFIYPPDNRYNIDGFGKLYYKCSRDTHTNLVLMGELEKRGYKRTYKNDWDIYLPCKDQFSNSALSRVSIMDNKQKIFFVGNNAYLGQKKLLWTNLCDTYGRKVAENIIPPIYVFPQDKKLFEQNYSPGKYYMVKNEKQRQEGLDITRDKNKILDHQKLGYNFVQEYIPESLLYNNHKINFRIYLVIINDPSTNKIRAFTFDDGIISYSKEPFTSDISFDNSIASFYRSGHLYDRGFPIILSQLKKMMDIPWDNIMGGIHKTISLIFAAVKDKIKLINTGAKTFQIFGVDFLIDKYYKPWLLEANISPGMDPHNNHDKIMRERLMNSIIDLVN